MESQTSSQRIYIDYLTLYPGCPPAFIAEAGINHNGSIQLAHDLIDAATEAGASIVKFQTHIPDAEMLATHPLWDVLSEAALSLEQHLELKQHAEANGLVFLSTPFSLAAVDLLERVGVSAYKTGSGELTHLPLQAVIAGLGKPTIISTGMSTLIEVDRTMSQILPLNQQLILMNCTSTYPTPIAHARVDRVEALQSLYPSLLIGQSDHTPTISTALAAITLGAVLVEKHLTLDKRMAGPDHAASLIPSEFKRMVQMGREVWEGLQEPADSEIEGLDAVKMWAEHSLVTGMPVKAGEPVSLGTLAYKRIGQSGGIPAAAYQEIANGGYQYARDVAVNHPLTLSDIRPT